ncbi:MAG: histidinol dehydrogenase [Gemmatimonadota bacterium]
MSAETTSAGAGGPAGAGPDGAVELFARGPLSDLQPAAMTHLLKRDLGDEGRVGDIVARLIDEVRARGDDALVDMAERFDGVKLDALEVPREAWDEALAGLEDPVRLALERAARNIRTFHAAQVPDEVSVEVEPGVRVTRVSVPVERAGVYAPGGRAAYPSSVLMGVVPARAAGVREVIVCSPPGPNGRPSAEVLAACAIGGADRLFAIGGAGAVAALAFGTESVPRVDAIVGPGNRWVTEAKAQVAGDVVIDSPAGPSEVLVLADDTADPWLAAAEMMAQAEHDPDAACVMVTTSERVARDTEAALVRQLAEAPRAEICRQAFAAAGAILTADSLDEAIDFTVRWAPEHLSVMTADAATVARRVPTAGTTFVGDFASVAYGDYMSGGNHVLPTAGRARSFSGLSTAHFLRSYTIQEIDERGARSLAGDVAVLAEAEGLPAHAAAALARTPEARAARASAGTPGAARKGGTGSADA